MKPLKKLKISLILILAGFACLANDCSASPSWQKTSNGLTEPVTSLYFSTQNSFSLAGTTKAIYRSHSESDFFVPVLHIAGSAKTVNQFYSNPNQPSLIYAATDAGVFVSNDEGRNWTNIYSSFDAETRKALSVFTDFENIYVGTGKGLYLRGLNEKYWQKAGGELNRKPIYHLADDNQYLYGVTDAEVYRLQKEGDELKKIFTVTDKSTVVEDSEILSEAGILPSLKVRDLAVSLQGTLYLALEQKILISQDHGESWKDFPVQGLATEAVKKLIVEGEDIVAATTKGVFTYKDGRWEADISGLESNTVNDLVINEDGELIAATSAGIFMKLPDELEEVDSVFNIEKTASLFKDEPTIKDVHRMAIKYAQVSPDQISRWHHQARTRAFFPNVSVGLARGDGELLHWDTTPNPDVLLKGHDYTDWSASLSWDLGDLIWSTDQTSIDSRSKLMSEMRQDILDQITRLYFERRRLQFELAKLEDHESTDYFDRQIRVDELTALIDGFTGGEYSKHLKN